MRRILPAVAAIFLLFCVPSPCRAGKPTLLVGPVTVEPAGARPSANDWGKAMARRLAERFRVVLPESLPADLETAIRIARAGRYESVLETRYTRIGATATLDLTLYDGAGRVIDTVAVDAPVDPSRDGKEQSDVPRLSIAAGARLGLKAFGDGADRGRRSAPRAAPPEGIVERSAPFDGRVTASAFLPSAGGKESGWVVADEGSVRFRPAREGSGKESVIATLSPGEAPPFLAAGELAGEAVVVVGRGRGGAATLVRYRSVKGKWVPFGAATAGLPLRVAGKGPSSVLLALLPVNGALVPGTIRFPARGGAEAPSPAAAGEGSGEGSAWALLRKGEVASVRTDRDGRVVVRAGRGEERATARPLGDGPLLVVPADLDDDGADEVLAVAPVVQSGAIFEALSVPSGSAVFALSVDAGAPPRILWRINLAVEGIAQAAADRDGSLHFLVREEDPVARSARYRLLRVR
jgi:hypothetical protein